MGDLEEACGSWLWVSSAMAVVATWGVNQMEIFVSVICLSNKNLKILERRKERERKEREKQRRLQICHLISQASS